MPPRFDSEKESAFLVALPCFSVQVSVQKKKNFDENIFFKTVIKLWAIKQAEGFSESQTIEYITRKTTLDRLVVKQILAQEKENSDRDTHETNYGEERNFFFLIYEPIGRKFLYPCISEKDYEDYHSVDDVRPDTKRHDISFSMKMEDHDENALMLGLDHAGTSWDQFQALTHPDQIPSRELEESKRMLQTQPGSRVTVESVNDWKPVWLVCNCGVDPIDLTAVSVNSVVSNRHAKYLLEILRDTAHNNPDANQELLRKLEKLEERRQVHLENAAHFDDEQRTVQTRLLSRYPDLRQYKDVQKKVSTFIARFPDDSSKAKDDGFYRNSVWSKERREEIERDFHTAMEAVFTVAVKSLYPTNKDEEIGKAIANLRPGCKNSAAYLAEMAKEIGFTDAERCRQFFEKSSIKASEKNRISKMLNLTSGQESQKNEQYGLMELVIAFMIEAYVEPQHPFRKIASHCPNFFEVVKKSKGKRDKVMHNDEQRDSADTVEELFRKKALLECCLELLSRRSDRQQEVELQKKFDGQHAAKVKTDEMVKHYASLTRLDGTKEAAWDVCYRFNYRDPQFFSECYNLMDTLLFELINRYECPNREDVLKRLFAGNTDAENWLSVQHLFRKYGCDFLKDIPASKTCDLFRRDQESRKWPMRSKLAVAFVTFDHDQPAILKKLLAQFPDIVMVADEIHKGRGHNNNTDFSASQDGYQGFTTHLLSSCEAVATMILEEKENGKE